MKFSSCFLHAFFIDHFDPSQDLCFCFIRCDHICRLEQFFRNCSHRRRWIQDRLYTSLMSYFKGFDRTCQVAFKLCDHKITFFDQVGMFDYMFWCDLTICTSMDHNTVFAFFIHNDIGLPSCDLVQFSDPS